MQAEVPETPTAEHQSSGSTWVAKEPKERQRLGSLLVLVVVGMYVGSGVMIQVLFDQMHYEKP